MLDSTRGQSRQTGWPFEGRLAKLQPDTPGEAHAALRPQARHYRRRPGPRRGPRHRRGRPGRKTRSGGTRQEQARRRRHHHRQTDRAHPRHDRLRSRQHFERSGDGRDVGNQPSRSRRPCPQRRHVACGRARDVDRRGDGRLHRLGRHGCFDPDAASTANFEEPPACRYTHRRLNLGACQCQTSRRFDRVPRGQGGARRFRDRIGGGACGDVGARFGRLSGQHPGCLPLDPAWETPRSARDPLTSREVVESILFTLSLPPNASVRGLVIERADGDVLA